MTGTHESPGKYIQDVMTGPIVPMATTKAELTALTVLGYGHQESSY
jgi:hypothetical protein